MAAPLTHTFCTSLYRTDDKFLNLFFFIDEATLYFYDPNAALERMIIQIARKSQDEKENNYISYKLSNQK